MISSINDVIRNSVIDKEFSPYTFDKFLNMCKNDDILRLFLCDYYKINYYKASVTNQYFNFPTDSESIERILVRCIDDNDFLMSIYRCVNMFNSLSTIHKIILLDNLTFKGQDEALASISKLHALDKLTYTFNCDVESIIGYYSNYNKGKRSDKDFIYTFLSDKLVQNNESKEYNDVIFEFLRIYYKCIYFIQQNLGKEYLMKNNIKYLNLISSNSIESLINYSKNDRIFLDVLLRQYLFYKTESTGISETLINNYVEDNAPIDIQKKLKLKGND